MTANLAYKSTDLGLGWGSFHGRYRYRYVEFAKLGFFRAAFSTVEKLQLVGVLADLKFQMFMRVISVPVGRLVKTPSIETARAVNSTRTGIAVSIES